MRHRPVRGRKNPSATIFARALGIGFCRFFSTAMREEKVRTLSALGPANLSAADRAMGCSMEFSRDWETLFSGEEEDSSSEKTLWSFSGSFLDGNEVSGAVAPVTAASSFWNPASSRAPRPRVERMEARWLME